MPRNSSGVYSLPESPFVPGTTIESSPVNSDLSDIADALTGSLPVNGAAPMTAPLEHSDGTVTAPSITFTNAPGTGFYLSGTNEMAWVAAGVLGATFNSDLTVDFEGAIGLPNAADANPLHLDWYEEGTFTPVLAFGGGTTDITYSAQTGTFTRIGKIVFVNIRITITSNGTSTGDATISGLPYASATPCKLGLYPFNNFDGLDEFTTNISAVTGTASTSIDLLAYTTFGDVSFNLDESNIVDNANFVISGFYFV